MAFNFTPDQQLAIGSRGSSFLVSAAAGSGKTRVLTERLMSYVTDSASPCDIDSFLVITYTRAAAAELRQRILDELGKRAAEPLNRHLHRQQNLCYRAKIGTIHSFCTDILRENAHRLGLSPTFRVMEEQRADAMKVSVLEALLDKRYESIESDGDFRLLADTVGAGRDDSRLAKVVLDVYAKLMSHPYPADWAAGQAESLLAPGISDIGDTLWGREILEDVLISVRFWAQQLDSAVADISNADEKLIRAYGEAFTEYAAAVRDFERALSQGWDKAREFLPVPPLPLKALRNYDKPELANRLKDIWNRCKKAAEGWAKTLGGSSAQLLADIRAAAPAMGALLELVLSFSDAFTAEKRRGNYLDFSDLEHLAVQLLVDKESGAPTWVAAEISSRFTEIMVDEYQDVNAVQEMIFRAVSRGGRNLFMVGDMKQSIYRFRLADIGIFMDKYRRYPPIYDASADSEGRTILLRENFRSRKSVLDTANHVFSNIMSTSLGELDYDEAAALKFGSKEYDTADDTPCTLTIIDPAGAEIDDDAPEKAVQEARFVGQKILSMVNSGVPVHENGAVRPCDYGDFAILLRSPSANGAVFHRELTGMGIPVHSRQDGGFFTSLEVTVALNLLSVIDNPHADVPLISVLRSPAFGFSPDELSAIRAADRSSDYYGALCACAAAGDEKCRGFLEMLTELRTLAPDLSISRLLWHIYDLTALPALCLAMSDGELRRGNLVQLVEYALRFEDGGEHGVFRFTAWMRALAEKGDDASSVPAGSVVKIMSIHKSKGLEFPFVFVSDLAHQFNTTDTSVPVLVHPRLGLGPKRVDNDRGIEYPTAARRAIERRMSMELRSEEMRVLYVAMTRAKERLFLTATLKNAEKAVSQLSANLSSPLPCEILKTASSFIQWLIPVALLPGAEGLMELEVVGEPAAAAENAAAENAPDTPDDSAQYALLRKNLSFVYPCASAADLPSKVTATGLKGRRDDAESSADSAALVRESAPERRFRMPELSVRRALTGAEKGTAAHALLQYMDLSKAADEAGVRSETARLAASGHLTSEQAESVDAGMVTAFGASDVCRRILAADEVHREFRFTLLVDADRYFDAPAGDKMLLQGIVDCFIVENGRVTVIDYKTDRVTDATVDDRAAHYAVQVRTYAMALERILGKPVDSCLLYFLRLGRAVEVKIS